MKKYVFIQDDPFFLPKVLDTYLSRFAGSTVGVNLQSVRQGKRTKWQTAMALLEIYGPVYFSYKLAAYAFRRVAGRILNDWLGLATPLFSVRAVARKHGVPVTVTDVNSEEFRNLLRRENVDLVVSISGTQLYRPPLLQSVPRGIINCHGALLPKYRGLMPSYWTLVHGEPEGGVSVHFVDEKLDNGPIVVQKRFEIAKDATLEEVMKRSKEVAAGAIVEAVERIEAGNVTLMENDASQATSFSMPTRADRERLLRLGHRFF